MAYTKDVPTFIRETYKKNAFMADFFNIKIDEIHCGGATVSVKIVPEKHMNHRGVVHGGVLTALADSVLGVTGASVGASVVTLNFSMNFIKNIHVGGTARVQSEVKHHGKTTMVIAAEMYNEENELMATILTTMFIVGHFDEIPSKW